MTNKSIFKKAGKTGVLLIHGCGGSPVEMQYVAHGLYKAGYTVYCPQLHGHGSTIKDLENSTWKDWYQSVVKAYYFLKQHCDTIIVGGLSAGSALALFLASKSQYKIDGVLLYAPALSLNGWAMPRITKILKYIKPWMIINNFLLPEREPYGIKDERVRNLILNSMRNDKDAHFYRPLSTVVEFYSLSSKVKKVLDKIQVPMLILHPKHDDMADISNSYEIIKKTNGSNELIVLDDSYHVITLDKQKNLVVEKSVQFVKDIEYRKTKHSFVNSTSNILRLV